MPRAIAPMMIAAPIEEISGTSVPALRRRSGANATRSSRMPTTPREHDAADERDAERQARGDERVRGERGGHEDRRVREIEDVEHAEDQRVADREQRVNGAQEKPVDELLREQRYGAADLEIARSRP